MSLLNRPSDGIYSVLIVLFKFLLAEKSASRDRLLALCAPAGTVPDAKQVRQTLNTWRELGLFKESADGIVSLHPDIRRDERNLAHLPHLARRLALHPDNNENFWAAEGARAADFTRSLCWLLAQDAWAVEFVGWDAAQELMLRQLPGGVTLVQNDTRWNGLKAWVPFLGLGWTPRYPSASLVADPAEAIRQALPEVFGRNRFLDADDMVNALSVEVPVIDGGNYRVLLEEKLRENSGVGTWQPPPPGQLSTSLSRALLRLMADGTLKGELLADAPRRVTLTGRNGSKLESFSRFTFCSRRLTVPS